MKKLSLYIFLVLMFCNVSFANDISKIEDIEINGISIGDNLLDHFSKHELIQNKKLLEANTAKRKLYYTSFIDQGMFYYESNEIVGMTEKPIYRIIGMSIAQSCDERSWNDKFSKDKSIRLLTECIETSFTKKLIKFDSMLLNLLDLYFEKKNDPKIEVIENGTLRYVESKKLGTGCYSDQVSVEYYSMIIKNKNKYYGPSMNIFLMSKELDEILYSKYC